MEHLRKRYPVDAAELPRRISLDRARSADAGEWDHVIPDVLPVGTILVYARPKCGKTRIVHQWVHCIAYRHEWAGYAPVEPGRCLVVDLENGAHMAMTASNQIAPYGVLEIDQTVAPITSAAEAAADRDDESMVIINNQWPGSTFAERRAEFDTQLREAKEAGRPKRLAVIDTFKAFIGPPPSPNMNAYDWERSCGQSLTDLAMEFGISLVIIHHSNKQGEISGSTGIAAAMTKVFRLNRPVGEKDGQLICEANRAGEERSWKGTFEQGVWTMTDEVGRPFVECTGWQALILRALAAGPVSLEEICTAIREMTPKPFARPVIKNALTRLREKGFIANTDDRRWILTEAAQPKDAQPKTESAWPPGSIGEAEAGPPRPLCRVCGEPMTLIEPDQVAHPGCDPDGQLDPLPETAPAPAEVAEDQDHEEDQAAELAEVCADCHEPFTAADTHPDCQPGEAEPPKWSPAFDLMRGTLKRSAMRPIGWIPPAGHSQAEGKQNRDMPQWRAALEADESAEAGFKYTRAGLLAEFGPDRLVVMFDRAQFFPSSCNSIPLAANLLFPYGPLEVNPHLLGKTDPKTGKPTGLAGVAEVIVPVWDHLEVPHPMGRRAVPGERMWIVTGLLEDMWKLYERGLLPRPVVTDSFLGRRTVGLLDPFAKGVGEAREKYADDPVMTAAVKRSSSTVLRLFLPRTARSPWWRPDWRAGIVSQGSYRLWIKAQRAVEAGEVVAGMERTDAISFLLPEGADPATWTPHGFTFGSAPGNIHHGDMQVRDSVDLSGIDPARITPAGHRRYVTITGPVPLRVWLLRRGGAHA